MLMCLLCHNKAMSITARRLQKSVKKSVTVGAVTHGQQITTSNTGRIGASAAGVSNYSATLTTVSGTRTYASTQTIRNTRFTGPVEVTGGTVIFEFCQFASQPAAAAAQLRLYNDGGATGTVICNWCDFATGLSGIQGAFETTCFQAGERGSANPPTTDPTSSFVLYRCNLTGAGNILGMHQFAAGASRVTESYLHDPTNGDGSHPDGMEIYSSNNLTVERSRIIISSGTDQSCLNITNDFALPSTAQPIIIQSCYINGGTSPVLTRNQGGKPQKVSYADNYFGDSSQWGRECDFNGMNVTFNTAYAAANPEVIYWAPSNVWAPNGEGITPNSTAPSGDTKAGLPHTYGSFVDERNFYAGEVWLWNGSVVGPSGGSGTKPTASNTGVPAGTTLTSSGSITAATAGMVIDARDVTGQINVTANNVTIQNSRITTGGYYAITANNGATGLTIKNCEIVASSTNYTGVTGGGFTLDGCYFRALENAITLTDGNAIVQNCFIEKLVGQGAPHYDGIEVYAGSNYQISNNNILLTDASGNWLGDTGAINVTATWGNITNTVIDGNWLGGGSYTLNLEEQGGYTLSSLTVTNNRWYGSAPKGHAAYGPIRAANLITTYSNNVWDDTSQAL